MEIDTEATVAGLVVLSIDVYIMERLAVLERFPGTLTFLNIRGAGNPGKPKYL